MFYKTNEDEIVFDEEYHVFEKLEDYELNKLWFNYVTHEV